MQDSLYQDTLFRKIVVASTGLGLACMLGSLAATHISKAVGLEFRWHWSILLLAGAALLWNRQFWRTAWQTQDQPDVSTKRKLLIHVGVLLALGVGSFLYPIRFIEQSYWSGIARGLVTAILFLGTMLFLIYKVGKGFSQIDQIELDRNSLSNGEK